MANVLVVDDDNDLLEMVSLVLSRNQFNVTCLTEGTSVLDAIETNEPDIILMDIYLGDADGRELCHTIKTSSAFSSIPVILYSAGHISNASIKDSMADEYLVKPFDISQLLTKINSSIKNNGQK